MAFYYYDHLKHRAGEGVQEGGGLIFLGDIGMFLFGGLFFMVCGCLAAAWVNRVSSADCFPANRRYPFNLKIAIFKPDSHNIHC